MPRSARSACFYPPPKQSKLERSDTIEVKQDEQIQRTTRVKISASSKEIEFVTLSPIEKAIYDGLCLNEKPLDFQRRRFLMDAEHHSIFGRLDDPSLPRRSYLLYIREFKDSCKQLKDLEAHIRKMDDYLATSGADMHEFILERLQNSQDSSRTSGMNRVRGEIVKNIRKATYFSQLMLGETTNEICDTCGKYFSCRTILPCKHEVCSPCMLPIAAAAGSTCPTCNEPVDLSEVKMPSIELPLHVHSSESDEDEWFLKIQMSKGSKFAAIVRYLYNMMHSTSNVKTIVFSLKENSLLDLLETLKEIDSEAVNDQIILCNGDVHTRTTQLEKFTQTGPGAVRILLLSPENITPDAHLDIATHVVLIDPIRESEGEAKPNDREILLEPERTTQFLVVDTIDQTDYEDVYGTVVVPRRQVPKSARK
uniref:RING-type domain-containing protein n=1 Tax=Vannella robusta TaxID=1487602 RepID=A0A7S4IJ87_9EUKA